MPSGSAREYMDFEELCKLSGCAIYAWLLFTFQHFFLFWSNYLSTTCWTIQRSSSGCQRSFKVALSNLKKNTVTKAILELHINTLTHRPVSKSDGKESDVVSDRIKPGQHAWGVVVVERLVVQDPETKLMRLLQKIVQVLVKSRLVV